MNRHEWQPAFASLLARAKVVPSSLKMMTTCLNW